ncbi:MAG: hypothetical protein JJU07_12535 [Natronohydrobacter sp.]|nr:hypothetical protein [Natronohydrobacter sp.]
MTQAPAFPWKSYIWALVAIVLIAAAPVLSGLLASEIASSHECRLNEARAHSCLVLGIDVGGLLYVMFVMTWFGMLTLPIGAMALSGLIIALVLHLIRRWRQNRA